jgi:hypothetical protein
VRRVAFVWFLLFSDASHIHDKAKLLNYEEMALIDGGE